MTISSHSAGHGNADDPRFSSTVVRAVYDTVADDYAAAFADDLARLPLDRAMLDKLVQHATPDGPVLDLGCGPAPVAAYLTARGAQVVGSDLSFSMLLAARARGTSLGFVQTDIRSLSFPADTFAAVAAYYSIQHLPRTDLPGTLAELARALVDGGRLLLATHLGQGDVFIEELLGHPIEAMGGALYSRAELVARLTDAGFRIEAEEQRGPLDHEVDTQRIYLLARLHRSTPDGPRGPQVEG